MKRLTFLLAIITCLILTSCNFKRSKLIKYVDPMIGSGGHGHVFVGANRPFGEVQLGPVNLSQGWDWCSGYHISDSTIIGFAHTHLSGTGIGDKGDILVMPIVGDVDWTNPRKYRSTFSHKNEVVEPGYYKVTLDNGVKVTLTSNYTVGYHNYTFPKGEQVKLLVNLKRGIGWDDCTKCSLKQVGTRFVEGYRYSNGWAKDDRVYFVMSFSKDIKSIEYKSDTIYNLLGDIKQITDSCYCLIDFGGRVVKNGLNVKVAISNTSTQGAKENYLMEGNKSFSYVKKENQGDWNRLFKKIRVTTKDQTELKKFYTAFYHAAMFPCIASDWNGNYRGADGQIHHSESTQFTIMSLWDIYRSHIPFISLVYHDNMDEFINSMLNIYDQQGRLPVWHLAGNETDCMPGVSSIQIIADAIMKNIPNFDYERAFRAMKSYADLDYKGLDYLRKYGFLPADSMYESVARALEYCVSDAGIASVAEKLGHHEDAIYFLERSKNYKKYFDPTDCFMKGLVDSTTRRTPFDPTHSIHNQDDFCEGNAWQYTWFVPCDFEGLISLFPSKEYAEAKLDSLFTTPYVPVKHSSPDISGMIGQYAHGNEPSHSTIFAYCFMGKPEKTAKLSRYIVKNLYTDQPDGQPGNEDCGAMSSWYLLNSMGIYQPNPVDPKFYITSPIFDMVEIDVGDGKKFKIIANGYDDEHYYHKSALLNGVPYTLPYINYSDIISGGTLELNAQ